MAHKVTNFEIKTTQAGKKYATASFEGEEGKVSVWEDHPQFKTLQVGYTIDGEIKVNDKGYKSLYAPRASGGSTGGMGGGMGKALMAEKANNIDHAQKEKANAIMVASTASMATQILTAYMAKGDIGDPVDWQSRWLEIRHWLIKNWGNTEQKKVGGSDIDYPNNNFPEGSPF